MHRVDKIRERMNEAFSPVHLEIIDDSAKHAGHAGAARGGGHFNVTIVSGKLTGNSLVARHQMVYQTVDDLMPAEIHALGINALTPEEYESS